eukprot:817700-Lingulodinium_polyedra.AAC.1
MALLRDLLQQDSAIGLQRELRSAVCPRRRSCLGPRPRWGERLANGLAPGGGQPDDTAQVSG